MTDKCTNIVIYLLCCNSLNMLLNMYIGICTYHLATCITIHYSLFHYSEMEKEKKKTDQIYDFK